MYFYLVERIGDGTRENPFRPDIVGSFVWSPDNVCKTCNTYIIATNEQIEYLQEVTDLERACEVRGLNEEDVNNWFVGD